MKRTLFSLLLLLFLFPSVFCRFHDKPKLSGNYFPAGDSSIVYSGRFIRQDNSVVFSMPAVQIHCVFTGSSLAVNIKDLTHGGIQADGNPAQNFLSITVDNEKPYTLALTREDTVYVLASSLKPSVHDITIAKRTESLAGKIEFRGIWLDTDGNLLPVIRKERKIEFIGNSISCGYGVESSSQDDRFSCKTENALISYTSLTAKELNADYHIVAYSGRGVAQNYDKSQVNTMPEIWEQVFPDEKDPAWDHSKFVPDVVVINLGTNDFNCGVTDTSLFRQKYSEFITRIRAVHPESMIICATGPMLNDNYPVNSLSSIRYLLQTIVVKHQNNGDYKVSFFELSQQTGDLGYGADWHSSAAQQQRNAGELTSYIRSITGWK